MKTTVVSSFTGPKMRLQIAREVFLNLQTNPWWSAYSLCEAMEAKIKATRSVVGAVAVPVVLPNVGGKGADFGGGNRDELR